MEYKDSLLILLLEIQHERVTRSTCVCTVFRRASCQQIMWYCSLQWRDHSRSTGLLWYLAFSVTALNGYPSSRVISNMAPLFIPREESDSKTVRFTVQRIAAPHDTHHSHHLLFLKAQVHVMSTWRKCDTCHTVVGKAGTFQNGKDLSKSIASMNARKGSLVFGKVHYILWII